jgi:hypothetical protein
MPERQRDFLSDLFQAVAERSRKLLRLQDSGGCNFPHRHCRRRCYRRVAKPRAWRFRVPCSTAGRP